MPSIKPFDHERIHELLSKDLPIITFEEHSIIGGLGSSVAEIIAESGKSVKFKRIGLPDTFSHYVGQHEYQRKMFGLLEKPSINFLKY